MFTLFLMDIGALFTYPVTVALSIMLPLVGPVLAPWIDPRLHRSYFLPDKRREIRIRNKRPRAKRPQ